MNVLGWELPNWDTHFAKMLIKSGTRQYQQHQRQLALKYTPTRNRCIDVGANVGFWAKDFIEQFNAVEAFEPLKENRICFGKNVPAYNNWNLYPFALSDQPGKQKFYWDPHCCGNAGLSSEGVTQGPSNKKDQPTELHSTEVEVRTIDSFNFVLVSLIKVDSQGSELEVLKGAYETLHEWKPTLCLELAQRSPMERQEYQMVKDYLDQFGYTNIDTFGKDTVWVVSTQN